MSLAKYLPIAPPGHCPYCLKPVYDVEPDDDGDRCHGHVMGPAPVTPCLTVARDVPQLRLFESLAFKDRSRTWRDDEWHEWKARVVREAQLAAMRDEREGRL